MKNIRYASLVMKCTLGILLAAGTLNAEPTFREGERVAVVLNTTSILEADQTPVIDEQTEEQVSEVVVNEQIDAASLVRKLNVYGEAFQRLISCQTDLIELSNGAEFQIAKGDLNTLQIWAPGVDDLVILQDDSWFFSSGKYRIANIATGDVVSADLKLTPYEDLARQIYSVNPYYNSIQLTDGSMWKIYSWDSSIFKKKGTAPTQRPWLPADTIIVGGNSSIWGGNFILINVNLGQVARCQLSY